MRPFMLGLLLMALASEAGRAQSSLNFSSSPGSTIQFNGSQNSFQFNSSTFAGFGGVYLGTQWFIGSETGGTGSAVGLFGTVGNTPFNYGPITVNGSEQSASVLGPLGALDINDGAGSHLTGFVNWVQIQTFNYSGALNASLVVNLTGLSYGGTNPDLESLVAAGVGQMNLTFQFSPGETLSQLSSGSNPFTTSYSGSISPAPEPGSIGLFLFGMGALMSVRVLHRPNTKTKTKPHSI